MRERRGGALRHVSRVSREDARSDRTEGVSYLWQADRALLHALSARVPVVRRAERYKGALAFHAVRPGFVDRYACGAKRDVANISEEMAAHAVESSQRCMRVGCVNDWSLADSAFQNSEPS
jgi:hypothetical protein